MWHITLKVSIYPNVKGLTWLNFMMFSIAIMLRYAWDSCPHPPTHSGGQLYCNRVPDFSRKGVLYFWTSAREEFPDKSWKRGSVPVLLKKILKRVFFSQDAPENFKNGGLINPGLCSPKLINDQESLPFDRE